MIIDSYKELNDNSSTNPDLNTVSYKDSDMNIFYMWHPPEFPSILPHWHERVEFLYVIEGNLNVTCGSFSGTAIPGDIIVSNPNQLHAAIAGKDGVKYYAFIFGEKLLKEIGVSTQNNQYINPVIINKIRFCNYIHDERVNSIFKDIIKEHTERLYAYELAIQSNILMIFSLMNRYYIDNSSKSYQLDNRFTKVIKYVSENFTTDITTESVAKEFCYDKAHFCRKFKQQTGLTFVKYNTLLRLELANSIIRSTNKSMTEIAAEVGFNDSNYFTRKYCQFYGIHPTDTRKKATILTNRIH